MWFGKQRKENHQKILIFNNLHAKQNGFKSAFQYKMKIKQDISDNEQKQKVLAQQQEKYQRDLSENQEELKRFCFTKMFWNYYIFVIYSS